MKHQTIILTLLVSILGSDYCLPTNHDDVRTPNLKWSWNARDYPNPKLDFKKCGQDKPSTICDPDSLLTDDDESALIELTKKVRISSPCLCKDECTENALEKGLTVGVALMKTIYWAYHEDKNAGARNFSEQLLKEWKMGPCGNDVLIMVIPTYNVATIVTGQAVKGFISEETIDDIFTQCKEYFDNSLYYEGLQSIINSLSDSMKKTLLKAPGVPDGEDSNVQTGKVGLVVGLVVGFACLAGFLAAGFIVIQRKRNSSNQNGFTYDGSNMNSRNGRDKISSIVKVPVVFPDAIYQPCSVQDVPKRSQVDHQAGSEDDDDNEDHYLQTLEENPAYESADLYRESNAGEDSQQLNSADPPAEVHRLNNLNRVNV